MASSLFEISDDVNQYLNLKELTTLATVSTNSFFRGLNNMKFNRFLPYENGEEILRKLGNNVKDKLSDIKGSSNLNSSGRLTPLHSAANNGNTEIVKLLLKEGAYVDVVDNIGVTPLFWAVNNNNIETVKLLINEGANVNLVSKYDGTPLYVAVNKRNIKMIELLINEGANVNIPNHLNMSPLHLAVQQAIIYNYTDIVKLLIKEGANVNVIDKDGQTPLSQALLRGPKYEIVELLMRAGAT